MSRELRIVSPRYGADIVGGSEALVRRLAHQLTHRGWSIEVWTTDATDEATWGGPKRDTTESDGDIAVTRFAVKRQRKPGLFAALSRIFFRLPQFLRPEKAWLRRQGPYAPTLIAALKQASPKPTLFTPYLFYPTVAGIKVSPGARLLMPAAHDERPFYLHAVAEAFASCDGLLFHTPEERDLTNLRYPSTKEVPSAVGSVGVESNGASPAGTTAISDQPYIYFGGRSTPGKGTETLLSAIEKVRLTHPRVSLVVSGPAAYDPAFTNHDGIKSVGLVDDLARQELVAGAVASVIPGTLESLSMLALESWAAGRPCIVNSGSAVLRGQARRSQAALEFSNADQLADAVIKLCDDDQLATKLGNAGRAFVERDYQWDQVADRLENLIDQAEQHRKTR